MIKFITKLFKKKPIKREFCCLPDWLMEWWNNSGFYSSWINLYSNPRPILPI